LADDADARGASRAPVVLAHTPPFRLGEAHVRPATREIVGPGGAEIVEPRVMQVLVALARAGGEILSRDDLIQACWEGRIVGENAIDRVISRLRRLAETAAAGSFRIETITKVGYGLVQHGAKPASPVPPPSLGVAEGGGIDRRALIWGGAALAVGGGGVWLGLRETRPDVPPAAVQHYDRGVAALRRGWAE
jgi:DNA-binding winged helix-turn-helix (wHTH) protein